ncbi:MAG: glutamate synthase domain-containing protein 2, partial [Candidatus Azotimanducaceae bacterium]
MRHWFYGISAVVLALVAIVGLLWSPAWFALIFVVPVILLGVRDSLQTRRAVLRNFPVIGHFRYLLEMIRPEINQYFIESNTDGTPFSRSMRSVAYQRAKRELQTIPFGTQKDVYEVGYEWFNHSILATEAAENPRIRIGEGRARMPYDASVYNISAMSFGSLSANAIRALNGGAKIGGFFHNTGEGGISDHHLEHGGDLCWQIGTGYFGCRNLDGTFNAEEFAKNAARPTVRLIEIKLSQGAKPGHGGILPGKKVTAEIARIRGVELGKDVLSPPCHSAFHTPRELLEFIDKLRELSGKPVGFKLCVGHHAEVLSICKAMAATGIIPDFIAVDGGEGGTGAAPVEFSDSVGTPLSDGIVIVHNALEGFGLRQQTKIIASGKIITGFQIA